MGFFSASYIHFLTLLLILCIRKTSACKKTFPTTQEIALQGCKVVINGLGMDSGIWGENYGIFHLSYHDCDCLLEDQYPKPIRVAPIMGGVVGLNPAENLKKKSY